MSCIFFVIILPFQIITLFQIFIPGNITVLPLIQTSFPIDTFFAYSNSEFLDIMSSIGWSAHNIVTFGPIVTLSPILISFSSNIIKLKKLLKFWLIFRLYP